MKRRRRIKEWLLTAPSLGWLLLFFVAPTVLVFALAFRPPDPWGGIGPGWTFQTFLSLRNPSYPSIIWRTIWISAATTILCLLFALPTGYYMARAKKNLRQTLVLLVIVPFWTSFLVRIFAWRMLLHPDGCIKQVLAWLGIVSRDQNLLYNSYAVLLVNLYTCLPFAILPIYAAAEKFDFGLLEAARDLGASRGQAFLRIFLPGISRGIASALLIVLIPSLGSYVVPDLVGGPTSEMIGNKIAQRVFVDRNLPHASALSVFLMLAVMLPLIGVLVSQNQRKLKGLQLRRRD